MKKKQKNKRKLLVIAAFLAVVSLIAGTFAWLTANDSRINRVKSAYVTDGSVTITEKFDPAPTEIVPGGTTKKEVAISNASSAPVYVRASYEEVLKYLTAAKDVTDPTEKYTATQGTETTAWTLGKDDKYETQGLGKSFPVLSALSEAGSPAALPAEYKGKTKISGVYDDASAFPAETAVYVSGKVTANPLDPTDIKYSVEAEFYTKVEIIKDETNVKETRYQVTDGKVVFDKAKAAANPADVTQWDVKVQKAQPLTYKVYPSGYAFKNSNWAESKIGRQPKAADKAAVLGSQGSLYGQDYNYETSIIGAIAAPTPATAKVPTAKAPIQAAKLQAVLDDDIKAPNNTINLNYNPTGVLDPAEELEAGKWVYNKADGWFYFTSPLASGVTTPNLLNAISYGNNISEEVSGAFFDLTVKIEAIQYVDDALTDTTAGWGLDSSDPILKEILKNKATPHK